MTPLKTIIFKVTHPSSDLDAFPWNHNLRVAAKVVVELTLHFKLDFFQLTCPALIYYNLLFLRCASNKRKLHCKIFCILVQKKASLWPITLFHIRRAKNCYRVVRPWKGLVAKFRGLKVSINRQASFCGQKVATSSHFWGPPSGKQSLQQHVPKILQRSSLSCEKLQELYAKIAFAKVQIEDKTVLLQSLCLPDRGS